MSEPSGWQPEVDEILERCASAQEMGGPIGVERQHAKGKLDVRERLRRLFDDGSFHEVGVLTGSRQEGDHDWSGPLTPSNVVVGIGSVDSQRVAAACDDYTVRSGTPDAAGSEKRTHIEKYAAEMRIPLVRLVDMAGASLKQVQDAGYTYIPGGAYKEWLTILSQVPVVSVACGPAPGLGAWRVAASHFSIQVEGEGNVFAAGPPVVQAGMGETVTAQDLGGVSMHAKHSGVVDNAAVDEDDALAQVKRFLSYLPPSVDSLPVRRECDDDPERRDEALLSLIPHNVRRGYDVRRLLKGVFDEGSVFEIGPDWGRSGVVGFARLDGYPVGFLTNDPKFYGGGMDEFSSEKFARHVDLCDTFHIPIVHLVDQPGNIIGTVAERRGTVRKGLRALAAVDDSSVPWFTVVVRRLFGLGGATYGPMRRLNNKIAWPSARWGALPIEGGVDALFKRDIEASEDPQARREELEAQIAALGSPLRTAEKFAINDVIDPRETRSILCRWVADAYPTLTAGPPHRGFRP